ncbi:LytTR family DNA-binding domain-containing protein [Sphingomonas oligophenolica]|uniref:LytTR family DNA-binding domain-containing protein n=1 Tax=Sphingomonas oligophenolica TaxID=301154 RepID=A0ABU9Y9A6_9SPHN
MIRAILCDDEPLALERLADMVDRIDGIEVAGQAGNGAVALAMIAELQPDIVFLDIEMPALDGFDVVEELARGGAAAPLIIFVTAYPQFAAHAFDTGAIDFLTKPVRLGRLETAIARARDAIESREARMRLGDLAEQLAALREERGSDFRAGNYLWVQRRSETVRVDLDLIDWVGAEGEYVRLHLDSISYLHREPLSSMLQRLDARRFLRIHRSYIVNRDRIVAVRRRPAGGYKIVLAGDLELPVGRSYRALVANVVAEEDALPG